MEKIIIYEYAKCSTCRKALKYLDANNIPYKKMPIVEQSPTKKELQTAVAQFDGDFKKLFNTSGMVYREMQLSKKIKTMTSKEAITLLNGNGKLVKRPFVLTTKTALVGFKEDLWDLVFKH